MEDPNVIRLLEKELNITSINPQKTDEEKRDPIIMTKIHEEELFWLITEKNKYVGKYRIDANLNGLLRISMTGIEEDFNDIVSIEVFVSNPSIRSKKLYSMNDNIISYLTHCTNIDTKNNNSKKTINIFENVSLPIKCSYTWFMDIRITVKIGKNYPYDFKFIRHFSNIRNELAGKFSFVSFSKIHNDFPDPVSTEIGYKKSICNCNGKLRDLILEFPDGHYLDKGLIVQGMREEYKTDFDIVKFITFKILDNSLSIEKIKKYAANLQSFIPDIPIYLCQIINDYIGINTCALSLYRIKIEHRVYLSRFIDYIMIYLCPLIEKTLKFKPIILVTEDEYTL